MYEIVKDLPSTAWILDLGSAMGSFDSTRTSGRVVRVDLNYLPGNQGLFVQSDAAYLPFADWTFDAIVATTAWSILSGSIWRLKKLLGWRNLTAPYSFRFLTPVR